MSNSVIADILFSLSTATAQGALSCFLKKKAEQARDILLDEVNDGDFSGIDNDDTISMLRRYFQAAANGEARVNLRILAQLIHGLLNNKDLQPTMYADKFNRYARILEGLSHEELQILATMYRFKLQNEAESKMTGLQQGASSHMADLTPYFDKAMRWLAGEVVFIKNGVGLVEPERGPKILQKDEFIAIVGALTRTGLLFPKGGWGGGMLYELSPLFFKITELVDFQEAFEKEGAA